MTTTLVPLTADDESTLRNLVQLYAYDFAALAGWELPDGGRFPDHIADGCFDGTGRHGFLLRAGDRLAGFAIIDTRSRLSDEDGVRDVAEFFVARMYRGRGVGAAAARALFDRFGGRWEVRQSERNPGATAFWRTVIDRYTGGRFTEVVHDSPRWRGPVQCFVCAG